MFRVLTSQIITLGSTPTALPPIPLEGREFVRVQNLGGVFVYLGNTAVTADTANTGGYQLLPKADDIQRLTDNVTLYGVISTGSSQVLIQEGK